MKTKKLKCRNVVGNFNALFQNFTTHSQAKDNIEGVKAFF